jgi:hypothetical protein
MSRDCETTSERISGPKGGYYIASYACPMGELGRQYMGMARISTTKPRSYWANGQGAESVSGDEFCDGALFDSAEAAMTYAEQLALNEIARRESGTMPSGDRERPSSLS